MIYYFSPFSTEKNLGKAYNDYMNLLPNDDDWACFLDGDVMFLTSNYGNQLEDIIKKYPNTGLFTCLTNRVGNLDQCFGKQISNESNILYHRQLAVKLSKEKYDEVSEIKNVISGHLMLVKKSVWKDILFADIPGKILSIDNRFSRDIIKAGKNILLMEGVYVFHYYRFAEGVHNRTHLKVNN